MPRPVGSRVEVSAPVLFFKFLFLVVSRMIRMCHGVPEIEMNNDFNFSAMAHSDKQISGQISTIVFSNALVEPVRLVRQFRFIFFSLRMRQICILEKLNFKIFRGSMPLVDPPSVLTSSPFDPIVSQTNS